MAIPGGSVQVLGPYDERLASLPDKARAHPAGDGVQPRGDGATPQHDDQSPTLESASAPLKFKTVDALVRSQERMTRNDWQIDTHCRRVRAGVAFSRLEKIPNQSVWVAKLPNGMLKESASAVPNKADDLCNKIEDTLMADPAKLVAKPRTNGTATQDAGDLATRWLEMDGGEAGTNDIETYRWALNNAFTGASSYLHYRVDKTGGGYQPLQKLAHPKATDPNRPLVALAGQVEENAVNPILRYVNGDQFVQTAAEAEKVWLPKLVIDRMRREQVRCFPVTAPADRASAVILIRDMSLAAAMREWPETVGTMSQDQLLALAQWKPAQAEYIVPYALRSTGDGFSGPSMGEVGSFSPLLQRRMYAYRLYIAPSSEYPGGYQLDISGAQDGLVLDETTLEYQVTLPVEGKTTRCKDIPIVPIRPLEDVEGGNPKGWPMISRFAGGSEASATLYGAFMDFCDNMLHPHVFIRSLTTVDEDDWMDRDFPIILHPLDAEPTYEKFPPLPPVLPLLDNLNQSMNVISGLTDTAQGLDSSNSVSGTAKNAVIRQAQISMSGFQQNLLAGMARGGRIKCQLVQAEFTVPQIMDAIGEEGSDEVEWWTGENFAGVDRVTVQPGTGTMQTAESKAQYVAFLQQQQWLAPDQAADVALPGIKLSLGLPEDPFVAGIDREIAAFLKGPPKGWVEANQQYQLQLHAYQGQQQQVLQQQQQAQLHAQSDAAMAPEREKQAAHAQVEQQKQQAAAQLEHQKAQIAMQQRAQEHQQQLEMTQAEAEAERAKHAPPAPLVVHPPDLSGIQHELQRLEQLVTASSTTPPAPTDLTPVVQALATIQREVQVLTQKVNAPAAIPLSSPAPKAKPRKGTITNAAGKSFTFEMGE